MGANKNSNKDTVFPTLICFECCMLASVINIFLDIFMSSMYVLSKFYLHNKKDMLMENAAVDESAKFVLANLKLLV